MARMTVLCPSCSVPAHFDALVPFRAECEACSADLHVCLACSFYDRYAENECRETEADPVGVKDRRNLCEYFRPRSLDDGGISEADRARQKLAALFGDKQVPAGSPAAPAIPAAANAAADARAKLEALFKPAAPTATGAPPKKDGDR